MTLDLTGPHRDEASLIPNGPVTPRPIALVTTVDEHGRINAAPFSFFNVLGTEPPIVGIAPGDRSPGVPKDTARNIRLTQHFVVNLVDAAIAEAMNLCSAALPHGVNELEQTHLTTLPSDAVSCRRIAEAPASLECRHHTTLEIGENRIIIGEVLRVHVREGIIDPNTWLIHPGTYSPIGRMQAPHWYCHTKDMFEMQRPR
jgi:flavin reductase (DIM6/NTAB) family NADH-FMN oxidoreductase RutF